MDLRRIDRAMRRVMLGLLWHHTNERLPEGHIAVVYSADGLTGIDSKTIMPFKTALAQARRGERHAFGDEVVTYWFSGSQTSQGRRYGHSECTVVISLLY